MVRRRKKPLFPAYGSSVPKPFAELEPEGPISPLAKLSQAPRLPAEARRLLLEIDTATTVALRTLAQVAGADMLSVVRLESIRGSDAPDVVAAFLAVPVGQVDVPLLDGRTAAQTLVDDLQVLLTAARADLDAARSVGSITPALIQHRYIADKYGSPPQEDPG